MKYLKGSLSLRNSRLTLGWSQFTKGHNSVKTVNVVRVLNLCTSSDVLHICTKFQENISKAFRVIQRMGFVY